MARERRRQYDVDGYVGLKLERNRWLPSAPYQHGFAWVGPSFDDIPRADLTDKWELFVGLEGNKWEYRGTYIVTKADSLSLEEWRELPEDVRCCWCSSVSD